MSLRFYLIFIIYPTQRDIHVGTSMQVKKISSFDNNLINIYLVQVESTKLVVIQDHVALPNLIGMNSLLCPELIM